MLKLCKVIKVKVFFLVLVYVFNFDLFEFSAAILEKGLLLLSTTKDGKGERGSLGTRLETLKLILGALKIRPWNLRPENGKDFSYVVASHAESAWEVTCARCYHDDNSDLGKANLILNFHLFQYTSTFFWIDDGVAVEQHRYPKIRSSHLKVRVTGVRIGQDSRLWMVLSSHLIGARGINEVFDCWNDVGRT